MGGGGKLKEQKDSDKWIARAEPSTIHLHYPQEWRMGLEAWSRKREEKGEWRQSRAQECRITSEACESKTGNLAILETWAQARFENRIKATREQEQKIVTEAWPLREQEWKTRMEAWRSKSGTYDQRHGRVGVKDRTGSCRNRQLVISPGCRVSLLI
jgi:hypothetical protein